MIAFSTDRREKRARSAKWMPVLMYHRVVDDADRPDPYRINITNADFEAQLAYLQQRGYQSIALDQVPLAASDESPWKMPIAITFDDGYRDNYTHALPLLKKYGLTATFMLVSDHIGGQNDWDRGLAELAPLMSLDQVREMEREGMHVGAHTATHPSLPHVTLKQVRSEFAGSKAKLEQLLGHEVRTLAYPYGRSTPQVRHVAEEVGFDAAFGVNTRHHSMFNFSRIDAAAFQGDTPLWRLNVQGAYHCLKTSDAMNVLNYVRKRVLARVRWTCRGTDAEPREDGRG